MRGLATGSSSFSTLVQVAPRLAGLARRLRPTWHLPSLAAVDAAFVRANDVRGLIWDVDGTLTGDRRPSLAREAEGAFRALVAKDGLRHVILSNASEPRYLELGRMFPEIPVLRAYRLGDEVLYRKLVGARDSWSAAELEARLSGGARVIRKPSETLVLYAIRELGCERNQAVMIGDQYFTDVAGANLAEVRSIKLPTLEPGTFRRSVRLGQVAERLVYAILYGRAGAPARRRE